MYAKKPEYLHCPPNTLKLNYKKRADCRVVAINKPIV